MVTYKQLHKFSYPAFLLPSNDVYKADGLVFVDSILVDDRNAEGETLGIRRLRTPFKDLLKLNHSVSSEIGVLKNRGNQSYIDSKGTIFTYVKTINGVVKSHRIEKVVKKETASTLSLKGINSSFIVPRPPSADIEWAGVFYLHGIPWKLYEFSSKRMPDTRRKV